MRYRFGGEKYDSPAVTSIEAMPTGPGQKRVFKVDLSKHKYIVGKEKRELDHHSILGYGQTKHTRHGKSSMATMSGLLLCHGAPAMLRVEND
jgi:hypothetical protein